MAERPDISSLMTDHQGLVKALAWKISLLLPRQVEVDDLVGYGMVGLAKAANSFDPARGQQFTTYAFYRVRGEILDNLRRMTWFDAAEYQDRTYERARSASGAADDSDDAGESGPARSGSGHGLPPAAGAMHVEMRSRLRNALEDLPAEALDLLRFVYYDGLSLAGAASRLGISRSWACRLHGRALEVLAMGIGVSRQGGVSEMDA